MNSSCNKRRVPRTRLRVPLSYHIRGSQSVSNTVVCDDISSAGIGFSDCNFMPPATKLMIQLTLAKKTINTVGKVAWVNNCSRSERYRMGVEFLEINPVDRSFLEKYIDCGLVTAG